MNKEIDGKQTAVGSISHHFKTPREHENKIKTYLELKKGFQEERTLGSGAESFCLSLHTGYGEASRQKEKCLSHLTMVKCNHGYGAKLVLLNHFVEGKVKLIFPSNEWIKLHCNL